MKKESIGKLALLVATLLWGFGFIAVENALIYGWSPLALLGARGIIGGTTLGLLSIQNKWYKDKKLLKAGIKVGIVMFAGFIFQTYGQLYSTPSTTAFLTTLYVVFTPLLSWLVLKQKMKKRLFISIILALVGSFVLCYREGMSFQLGDILILICALFFAIHIMLLDQHHTLDPISFTAVQLLTTGILSLSGMLIMQESPKMTAWWSVLYGGLIASALASCLQTYGQKYVKSSVASLILSLESVFGALCSLLFLNETLTINIIAGGTLLFVAVLTSELN